MTEERERIMQEARNGALGMGAPLIDQAVINSWFPLTRLGWDFNMAEGKGHLKVYFQVPLACIKGPHENHKFDQGM